MKSENFIMRIIARFLYLAILLHLSPVAAQLIPASDRVNWPGAGLWTDPPSCADTVFQVNLMSGANWDEKFANARAQAKSYINSNPTHWAIIYFPSGTYTLTTEVNIDQSYRNIVIQGAGSNKTTLVFQNRKNYHCFSLTGTAGAWSSSSDLDQNLNKGESILHSATGGGLSTISTGDWVHLIKRYFDYNDEHDELVEDIVGQITRLGNGYSTYGTLKDPASKQYTVSRNTSIWPITPVQNIGIENLLIKREDTGHPGDGDIGLNINFLFAVNCWALFICY